MLLIRDDNKSPTIENNLKTSATVKGLAALATKLNSSISTSLNDKNLVKNNNDPVLSSKQPFLNNNNNNNLKVKPYTNGITSSLSGISGSGGGSKMINPFGSLKITQNSTNSSSSTNNGNNSSSNGLTNPINEKKIISFK